MADIERSIIESWAFKYAIKELGIRPTDLSYTDTIELVEYAYELRNGNPTIVIKFDIACYMLVTRKRIVLKTITVIIDKFGIRSIT